MQQEQYDFGMVGLGVMGRNLLLNMADNGFSVIGFDKDEQKGKALESAASDNTEVKGVTTLKAMVEGLKKPRKIILLVPAGAPVDSVLTDVAPLLEKGDIVIDGGNSYFKDTNRRVKTMQEQGLHFMGMGVSGGEEGARRGPSMMPGGDEAAWHEIRPVLEAIAAKVNGEPCVAYMGKDAAGHFVKMVHNGIEYAIMQLISEAYDILHRGAGTSNEELHIIFDAWNKSELESFLIEITARVFTQKDQETGQYLVDLISDKAGSKGTGKWTSQEAMDLGIAIPTIDTAVAMRALSAVIGQRKQAAEVYKVNHSITPAEKEQLVADVKSALQFAIITCYAQGLSLLQRASVDLKMDIPLADVIKAWRGGCIIRSVLLKDLYNAFSAESNLENILLNTTIAEILKQHETAMRRVVTTAFEKGLMSAGLASALSYFDAFTTARMPTNLVQAQRDLFGAHTYERIDKPGSFHTEWN